MSMSIYYEARRSTPLTDDERAQILSIEVRYSVEDRIEQYNQTGGGFNWESFCVYDPGNPTASDVIFEGATGLPTNSAEVIWEGIQHWCSALTEIRGVLRDADWEVRVDTVQSKREVVGGRRN